MNMPLIDLAGQRFGRLLALSYSTKNDGRKTWVCQCDCGVICEIRGSHLRMGKTISCGCYIAEKLAVGLYRRHGMYGTAVHSAWSGMHERCAGYTPRFDRYFRRGITVCDRWKSFENFLADMGPPPKGMTLDRIDNNGNYEPANCRWTTMYVQANNRENNRKVVYQGKTYNARELSELSGVSYHTLRSRIFRAGWPIELAVIPPAQPRKRRAA